MKADAASLVERLGGTALCVPAMREVVHTERIPPFIDKVTADAFSLVVFLTGFGVSALLREAERLGRLDATLAGLRRTVVACRGPKPLDVLEQYDVPVAIRAAEPHTRRELLDALTGVDLKEKAVALVHQGEPNVALAAALKSRGARLEEVLLYEWRMPEDVRPLESLVRDVTSGAVDAVAFTNEIQGRHLVEVARRLDLQNALVAALNADTIVAAVGPVCAGALQALGIVPDVIPAHPTMASMIDALAGYFDLTEGN